MSDATRADRDFLVDLGFEPGGWDHSVRGEMPRWVPDPGGTTLRFSLPGAGFYRTLEAYLDDGDPAHLSLGYYSFHASSRGGWQQVFSGPTRGQVVRLLDAFREDS